MLRKLNVRIVDRYGLGKVTKEYGFYPGCFPITVGGEHGPSLFETLFQEGLSVKSPYYFYYAKRKSEANFGSKIGIRYPSPFIWYRNRNKIQKECNANGSIYFFAHSTGLVKAEVDYEEMFSDLEAIPNDFKPITFCLHFNSIKNPLIKLLEEKGIKWICLGENYEDDMIKKFYAEVPKYKYALGNNFTSGMLYCLEMGIPCSIISIENVKYNNNGNNEHKHSSWSVKEYPYPRIREAISLFRGFNRGITKEQKMFAYNELGYDLINSFSCRLKVSFALYSSLIFAVAIFFKERVKSGLSRIKRALA